MIVCATNAARASSLIAVRTNDGLPSGSVNDGRVADAEHVNDPSPAITRCSSGALSDPTVPRNAPAPAPCSSATTSSIVRSADSAAATHSTAPPRTPPAALSSSTARVKPRCWPIDSSLSSPAPGVTNPSTRAGGPVGAGDAGGVAVVPDPTVDTSTGAVVAVAGAESSALSSSSSSPEHDAATTRARTNATRALIAGTVLVGHRGGRGTLGPADHEQCREHVPQPVHPPAGQPRSERDGAE